MVIGTVAHLLSGSVVKRSTRHYGEHVRRLWKRGVASPTLGFRGRSADQPDSSRTLFSRRLRFSSEPMPALRSDSQPTSNTHQWPPAAVLVLVNTKLMSEASLRRFR